MTGAIRQGTVAPLLSVLDMHMTPPLVVFPSRYVLGASHPDHDVSKHHGWVCDESVLAVPDARHLHTVPYILANRPANDTRHVRLDKPSVGAGLKFSEDEVLCNWIHLDVDGLQLTPELADQWVDYMISVAADPQVGRFHYWCTTAGGMHMHYALSRPLRPSEYERKAAGLRDVWLSKGVKCDDKCSDWTRFMALPRVTKRDKDGEGFVQTWTLPWYRDLVQPGVLLDPDTIPDGAPTRARSKPLYARPLTVDPHGAYELCFQENDRSRPTAPTKRLVKELRALGNPQLNDAVDGKALQKGERDSSLTSIIGAACNVAVKLGKADVTRDHLYGVLVPCCWATDAATGYQDDGSSWCEKAAQLIARFWDSSLADLNSILSSIEDRKAETKGKLSKADLAARIGVPGITAENVGNFLALKNGGKSCWVLHPSGAYYRASASAPSIQGALRRSGIADLFPIFSIDSDTGEEKLMRDDKFNAQFTSTFVSGESIHSAPGDPPGGRIHSVNEGIPVFCEAVAQVFHIEPAYSPRAERTLRIMFDTDAFNLNKALFWLSNYPRFGNVRLPALIVTSAPSCGKSFLGEALSKFCTTASPPAGQTGEYDGHLRDGILQLYDDKSFAPIAVRASRDSIAGRFEMLKRVVSGLKLKLNPKGTAQVDARLPWRIVVLQNGHDFETSVARAFPGTANEDHRMAILKRVLRVRTRRDIREEISALWGKALSHEEEQACVDEFAGHIAWLAENWVAPDNVLKIVQESSLVNVVDEGSAYELVHVGNDEAENTDNLTVVTLIRSLLHADSAQDLPKVDARITLDGQLLVQENWLYRQLKGTLDDNERNRESLRERIRLLLEPVRDITGAELSRFSVKCAVCVFDPLQNTFYWKPHPEGDRRGYFRRVRLDRMSPYVETLPETDPLRLAWSSFLHRLDYLNGNPLE